MPLDSDRMIQILLEVTLGKQPEIEDTEEEAAFRKQTAIEVQRIKDQGGIVEIPSEWPLLD